MAMLGAFYSGLADIAHVSAFGAQKYGLNNWQLCEDLDRYRNALARHVFAYLSGEWLDPESGKPHLAHAGWNCLALMWFKTNEKPHE